MDSNATPDDSIDPIDEQLLALLDGDLEGAEREALERRLVDDPQLRKRMRALQRSWEVLNDLPHRTVDHRFASTTVEVIVKKATQELEALPLATTAGNRGKWTLMIACASVFLLGMLGFRMYQLHRFRDELIELGIAEHMSALQLLRVEQDDLPFLEELLKDEEWLAHVKTARELGKVHSNSTNSLVKVPVNERQQAISAMDEAQRSQLESIWQDWKLQTDSNRELLRKRYEILISKPNGIELIEAADLYDDWLKLFNVRTAAEISDQAPKERLARMKKEFVPTEARWKDKASEDELRQIWLTVFERIEQEPDLYKEKLNYHGWLAQHHGEFQNWFKETTDARSALPFIMARLFRGRGAPRAMTQQMTQHGEDDFLAELMKHAMTEDERAKVVGLRGQDRGRFVGDVLVSLMKNNDFFKKLYFEKIPESRRDEFDLTAPEQRGNFRDAYREEGKDGPPGNLEGRRGPGPDGPRGGGPPGGPPNGAPRGGPPFEGMRKDRSENRPPPPPPESAPTK